MKTYSVKGLLGNKFPSELPDSLDATFEGPEGISAELIPGAYHNALPNYAYITVQLKLDEDPIGRLTSEYSEALGEKSISVPDIDMAEVIGMFKGIRPGPPRHPHCPSCQTPIPLSIDWRSWIWICPQCGAANDEHPVFVNCVNNEKGTCSYAAGELPCPFCGEEFEVLNLMRADE